MYTVFATFTDPEMAKKAVGALMDYGVSPEELSILYPTDMQARMDYHEESEVEMEHTAETGLTTTTPADAASGAVKGAGLGFAAGTLIALSSIFIPGFGLVLGGGALAIAIAGAAGSTAAGAVAGGVTGYLKDQGIPEQLHETYGKVLTSGGVMVSVTHSVEDIDVRIIEEILAKYDGSVALQSGHHILMTS